MLTTRTTTTTDQAQLGELRQAIDGVDVEILRLLNHRAALAQDVGRVKARTTAPVFRPEREAAVLRHLTSLNQGPLKSLDVQTIFREIISACRGLEKRLTVAFLGPSGTFSEQAVLAYFGHAIDLLSCASIDDVFRQTESGEADFGLVPIENSSEGAVNRTLDCLLQTSLSINGEISLPIHHCLMRQQANDDGAMNGITRVCAHAQALAQCQHWLNQHYPTIARVAVPSNAEAARIAREDASVAAIASERSAQVYDLQVIHAHIQDDAHNRTRFVVLGRLETHASGQDQTSLILSAPNKAGAMLDLLAPIAKHGVSMTRIESRPARMGAWEYTFYVDLEGHARDENVAMVLKELKQRATLFKQLGSYPRALA